MAKRKRQDRFIFNPMNPAVSMFKQLNDEAESNGLDVGFILYQDKTFRPIRLGFNYFMLTKEQAYERVIAWFLEGCVRLEEALKPIRQKKQKAS